MLSTGTQQAFRTSNGSRPMCLRPRTQTALHTPYRIFAICNTTWPYSSHHRFQSNVAIFPSCLPSSSTTSAVPISQLNHKVMLKTYLTSLGVMLSRNPPLSFQFQVPLKVEKQVCRWHCSSREEVSTHPALFKVVWRGLMIEDMNEQLP